jgi:hypothetical protein
MDWITHILPFLLALASAWLGWIGAIVSAGIEVAHQAWKRGKRRRVHWRGIVGIGIFLACYQAWLYEREKNEGCLNGEINQVVVGTRARDAVLIVELTITNACESKRTARAYSVDLVGAKQPLHAAPIYTGHKEFSFDSEEGTSFLLPTSEFCFQKTSTPITEQSWVTCWLLFHFNGQTTETLRQADTLAVNFDDARGNHYKAKTPFNRAVNTRPEFYPGSVQPFVKFKGQPLGGPPDLPR